MKKCITRRLKIKLLHATNKSVYIVMHKSGRLDDDYYYYQYCHIHTRVFNGRFSGTIRVSRYQKGKTNVDFTE